MTRDGGWPDISCTSSSTSSSSSSSVSEFICSNQLCRLSQTNLKKQQLGQWLIFTRVLLLVQKPTSQLGFATCSRELYHHGKKLCCKLWLLWAPARLGLITRGKCVACWESTSYFCIFQRSASRRNEEITWEIYWNIVGGWCTSQDFI